MRIFFLFTILLFSISCNQTKEKQNYDNVKKVKKDMHLKEVLNIMGNPDYITDMKSDKVKTRHDSIFIYEYAPPLGFSGYIQVWFHKRDSLVYSIHDGL